MTAPRPTPDPTPDPSAVPPGVWRSSLQMVAGRFAGGAATALELVCAARILPGADFGRWTFLLAALLLVESISDLGTGAAALQRGANDEGAFARALNAARRTRFATVSLAALLLFSFGLSLGEDPRWIGLACLLPLSRIPETSGLVFQRALQWGPLVAARGIGALARGIAVPLLLFLGVRDISLLLAAHAGGLALGNVLVHLAAKSRGLLPQDRSHSLALWRLALPLGCAALTHQAALYADNWILRSIRGEVELGQYNAAARIASFLLMFAANAGTVALPWLAGKNRTGQLGDATAALTRGLLIPAALILGVLMPQADLLLGWAFGESFGSAATSLRVLLLGALVVSATTGWLTALVATGAGRSVLLLTGCALLANVIGNLALVPHFGGIGAAGATLGTELLLSGGAWVILRAQGRAPRVAGSHWIRALAVFVIAVLLSAALRALLTP
ncbi:MAG: O-antigen/teichoic acid export membrane protein [Planctomycetota bacterium]|jgi:O-antigen/teichoic acid export membrane protein